MAVAAILIVLAVAGAALAAVHQRKLTYFVERGARQRLDDISALIVADALPDTLPVANDDSTVTQVVTLDGRVVLASPRLKGLPPLDIVVPPGGGDQPRRFDHLPWDDDRGVVLSRLVSGPHGDLIVHAGVSLEQVREAVLALRRSLLIALPLVTVLFGLLIRSIAGRMLAEVDSSVERQRRFVADASHELRSPLARMRIELEVDMAHPHLVDPLAAHRSLLVETIGLQALVDDLLVLAQHDAGVGTAYRPVQLDQVVRARVAEHESPPAVTIRLESITVMGDAAQLRRAVDNLLDNAIRHATSAVEVDVVGRDGVAELIVADDGPGVPEAMRTAIFDRFARTDEARRDTDGGSGLGLAIVRGIVERHGGTVDLDPQGPGARFVVRLPVAGHS